MPSKKSTTVVLHKEIQKIKTELAGIYGLKNLLSAGILLFSRLTDSHQKKVIKEVNNLDAEEPTGEPEELLERLREEFAKEQGGKVIITSADVSKIITEFRNKMSPTEENSHYNLKRKKI